MRAFFRYHGVMAPGVRLMRRLRFGGKMAVILSCLALPFLVLVAFLVHSAESELRALKTERTGTAYLKDLVALMRIDHQYRRAVREWFDGDRQAAARIADLDPQWTSAYARLQAGDRDSGARLGAGDAVAGLGRGHEATFRDWQQRPALDVMSAMGLQIQAENELAGRIGDASGLVLDSDLNSYYLMSSILLDGLPLREALGLTRGLGAQVLRSGKASAAERTAVQDNARSIHILAARIERDYAEIAEHDPALESELQAHDAILKVRSLGELALADGSDGTPATDAALFLAAGDAATQAADALMERSFTALERSLSARLARARAAILAYVGAALAAVALSVYSTISFYRVMQGGLARLNASIEHLARGDLGMAPSHWGRDEIGDCLSNMKAAMERMGDALGRVHQRAEAVCLTSGRIAAGNQDLSLRTKQVAGAIEHTSGSMEQLRSTVESGVESVSKVDDLMQRVQGAANDAERIVGELVERMGEIHRQSREIGEIVGLIDGIAFQTNILALNASVEAARAGEMGRGFAVVAQEVRALAQRSAESARQIKRIIGESAQKIEAGTQLTRQAGSTASETLGAATEAAGLMKSVRQTTHQQSSTFEELSGTLTQMIDATQSNFTLVAELATAADELSAHGMELYEQMGHFTSSAR